MKKLILIRHAKSSWDDSFIKDHDRTLSERGLNDAPLVGKFLNKKNIIPDLILTSTAKRASNTAELILNEIDDKNVKIKYDKNIYLTGPGKIIDIISNIENDIKILVVVGHNPDMQMLVERLTNKHFPHLKFSTAGVAIIDFEIESWNEIKTTHGVLEIFLTPKMLY